MRASALVSMTDDELAIRRVIVWQDIKQVCAAIGNAEMDYDYLRDASDQLRAMLNEVNMIGIITLQRKELKK